MIYIPGNLYRVEISPSSSYRYIFTDNDNKTNKLSWIAKNTLGKIKNNDIIIYISHKQYPEDIRLILSVLKDNVFGSFVFFPDEDKLELIE